MTTRVQLMTTAFLGLLCLMAAANGEQEEREVQFTGTVIYLDIEGGFYGIEADDGTKYLPINLPRRLRRRDRPRVRVKGTLRPDMVGFYMWGTYLEIDEIETLDAASPEPRQSGELPAE